MNLNQRERKMILFCTVFIVLGLLYRIVAVPYLERWDSVVSQTAQMEKKIARAKYLQSHPLTMTYSRMTIENQTATTAAILQDMETYATEAGVTIGSIRPGPILNKGNVSEMSFDIEVNGVLSQVCNLLAAIEKPQSVARINKIRMGKSREDSMEISATINISSLGITEVQSIKKKTNTTGEEL